MFPMIHCASCHQLTDIWHLLEEELDAHWLSSCSSLDERWETDIKHTFQSFQDAPGKVATLGWKHQI